MAEPPRLVLVMEGSGPQVRQCLPPDRPWMPNSDHGQEFFASANEIQLARNGARLKSCPDAKPSAKRAFQCGVAGRSAGRMNTPCLTFARVQPHSRTKGALDNIYSRSRSGPWTEHSRIGKNQQADPSHGKMMDLAVKELCRDVLQIDDTSATVILHLGRMSTSLHDGRGLTRVRWHDSRRRTIME